MTRRVIKVSKKTLDMFKDALGVNDPRRVSDMEEHYMSNNFFITQFLDEDDDEEYIRKSQTQELFGDDEYCNDYPDINVEMYYVKSNHPCMNTLIWRCKSYSKEWKSVTYNTSSIFAYNMCSFDSEE